LHTRIVSKTSFRRNRKAVLNKVQRALRGGSQPVQFKESRWPSVQSGMDDVHSSEFTAKPGRHEATGPAGYQPGPLSPTLLDALRAYVRYNQAAIEVTFRKAFAAATARDGHFRH
jgi:hypothetical protein